MGIVSDASIISKSIDGVIYIVGANETDISHANMGIDNLKKVDANIIGAVLNKYVAEDSMHGYYGYYYKEESSRSSRRNKDKKKGIFNILAR